MPETPLLGLPILEAAQAQKHVTHNEALLLLDAAIHLSVISRGTAIPPVAPLDGDRYLVASGPAGAWAAQAGKLAIRQNGGWLFAAPRKGWRVWVEDEETFLVFDGAAWRDLSVSGGDKGDIRIGGGGIWRAERTGGAVGDGVSDDTAALQSVLSAGRSLVLDSTKTYRITQRLNITAEGTGIEGHGARIVMSTAAGHFDNGVHANRYGTSAVAVHASGVSDVIVRNVRIAPDAWVDLRYLKAISLTGCDDARIEKVEAWNFSRGSGVISLNDCDRATIEGCHIHDCWSNSASGTAALLQITGIEIDNDAATGSAGGVITGCRFENLTVGNSARAALGYQTDGVSLLGRNTAKPSARGWLVANNSFINLGEGIDNFNHETIISGNYFRRCFSAPVSLKYGASRVRVSGNTIIESGLAGIYLSGSTLVGNANANELHGNIIQDVGIAGDWINADGGRSYDSALYGSAPSSAGQNPSGIRIETDSAFVSAVTNTNIADNSIDGGGTGEFGIYVGSAAGGSATQKARGNTISGFTGVAYKDDANRLTVEERGTAATLLGNNQGIAATRADLTAAQARALLNVASAAGDLTADAGGNSALLARHDLLNAAWNGAFEMGDAGWLRQTGWTIQNDPANARGGNWVAACSSVTGVATDLRTLNQNRVRAGETVYAECWVKSSAGAAFTTLQIMIRWLDKDLAAITSSSGTNFNTPQTSYVLSNVTAVAPANAAYYVVNVRAAQTSGTIWVDDAFSFRRRDAASLLANASVTSALLGGDITAAGKALLIADDAAAQTAQLSSFTAAQKGLVPASGGGAINFLRADGTWSAPPAGGGGYHAVATLAADVATAANTTPVSLTGLSFSFEANAIYFFRWIGATSAAATTTGSGFQLDLDVAVTDIRMSFFHQLANTGTITGGSSQADDVSSGVSSGNPVAGGEVPVTGRGMLRTGPDAGTAQLRLRSEVAAVVTARAGMTLVVERVA